HRPMTFGLVVASMVYAALIEAAQAQYIPVIGRPTFNPSTDSGFKYAGVPQKHYGVDASGTAVGTVQQFSGGTNLGYRPLRWDSNGIVQLGTLGVNPSGFADGEVFATN